MQPAGPSSSEGVAESRGVVAEPPPVSAPGDDAEVGPPPAILLTRSQTIRPREIAALIAIVALADLTLYEAGEGMRLALLFTGVPAILAAVARGRVLSPRLWAVSSVVALVALRCMWQPSAGVIALGAAMLLPFAIALRSSRSYLPELVVSSLASAWESLWQLAAFGGAVLRIGRLPRSRRAWAAYYLPAVLVLVFGAIFAAANPVIQGWLSSGGDLLSGAMPTPLRVTFWAGAALAGAGLLRPVLQSMMALDRRLGYAEIAAPGDGDGAPSEARLALARNGLIGLNLLFLGYNALDAVYLWAGRAPSGTNHTAYAHAGTAWLSIAFVLSTIVLGAMFRGPIAHAPEGRIARGLAYAWAVQNFILAAGTFRRIAIYIDYSGLTELRIVGMIGTALATAGLAIVVIKLARGRTMLWVMRRQLDALAVAVALYLVAPTGYLAMHYNAARIAESHYRPLLHLYEQSLPDEAIPALLPLLDHPDPIVREGVAVIVGDRRVWLSLHVEREHSWLDVELARRRALGAIADAAVRLDAVMPANREAAASRLRGLAYGANDEGEPDPDEAHWRGRSY
jgi:hypothetical protein